MRRSMIKAAAAALLLAAAAGLCSCRLDEMGRKWAGEKQYEPATTQNQTEADGTSARPSVETTGDATSAGTPEGGNETPRIPI